MHDGTLVTDAPTPQSRRTKRVLLLAAVLSAVALAGCASRSQRAPVADHSSGAATQAATGTYVVRPGDTLYKIAQAHGMEVSRLVQLNNITDPSQLGIGQVLRLDAGTPQPAGGTTTVATPVTVPANSSTSAPPPPVSTSAARASDANLLPWGWPADGKIIQSFTSSTKGIDIEGPVGSPVQAAADGKVLYAGNGVRGLGNLILLGHSNGFITAYAHNQTLLVKTGSSVKKGTKIATMGQTDTTSPRLHFEVRRSGTPVNPLSYLPAR